MLHLCPVCIEFYFIFTILVFSGLEKVLYDLKQIDVIVILCIDRSAEIFFMNLNIFFEYFFRVYLIIGYILYTSICI